MTKLGFGLVLCVAMVCGYPRLAHAQPPSSNDCGRETVYVGYKLLAFMQAALNDPNKFALIEQQFAAPDVAELRSFLGSTVKAKPMESIAILVLRFCGSPTAEYKLVDDFSPLPTTLHWSPTTVRVVSQIVAAFRHQTIKWEQLVTSLKNDTASIDEGWKSLAAFKDSAYIATPLAANLSEVLLVSVQRRQDELSARIKRGDETAKQIQQFRSGMPWSLRDGKVEMNEGVPNLTDAQVERFEKSYERATGK